MARTCVPTTFDEGPSCGKTTSRTSPPPTQDRFRRHHGRHLQFRLTRADEARGTQEANKRAMGAECGDTLNSAAAGNICPASTRDRRYHGAEGRFTKRGGVGHPDDSVLHQSGGPESPTESPQTARRRQANSPAEAEIEREASRQELSGRPTVEPEGTTSPGHPLSRLIAGSGWYILPFADKSAQATDIG